MSHPRLTKLASLVGSVTLACAMAFGTPAPARAETVEELEAKAEELGKKVQEAAQVYATAISNVETLDRSIEENEAKVEAVRSEIPEQRAKSASAIRTLYKMSQNRDGLLELLLSSDDFNSFISTLTYLNAVEDRNTQEAEKLATLQDELSATQAQLQQDRAEAEAQRQAANDALAQAEELRQQAVQNAAKKAAEEAAKKAAEEAARNAAASAVNTGDVNALSEAVRNSAPQNQPRPEQPSPSPDPEPAPSAPENDPPAQSSDRDAFVSEWTQRIDDYLAGSPLAGYGYAFAEAAYDYGVDPRWSPAISTTESGKGSACFLPHNAWGWGAVSWPDWDTAIRSHVRGLSEGYGYTISEESAQKYCPPTWQDWYYVTLNEMAKI